MLGPSTVPPMSRSALHSLSRPSPVTISRLRALALMSSRQGTAAFLRSTTSPRRLSSITLRRGIACAAVARPSTKRLRSSVTSPPITPPRPSVRMVSGPVTVAPRSSRLRSTAFCASTARSMPNPSAAARLKLPRADTVPPAPAFAVISSTKRREPSKRPRASRSVSKVPVIALSSRALLVRTLPRMTGAARRPVTSAPIETGPERSKISTPVIRHSVSPGPA